MKYEKYNHQIPLNSENSKEFVPNST